MAELGIGVFPARLAAVDAALFLNPLLSLAQIVVYLIHSPTSIGIDGSDVIHERLRIGTGVAGIGDGVLGIGLNVADHVVVVVDVGTLGTGSHVRVVVDHLIFSLFKDFKEKLTEKSAAALETPVSQVSLVEIGGLEGEL